MGGLPGGTRQPEVCSAQHGTACRPGTQAEEPVPTLGNSPSESGMPRSLPPPTNSSQMVPSVEGHSIGGEPSLVLGPVTEATIPEEEGTSGSGVLPSTRVFLVRLPDQNPLCLICGDHVGRPSALALHCIKDHSGADVQYQYVKCECIS